MEVVHSPFEFSEVHKNVQSYIDRDILAGAASVIIKDQRVVDFKTYGVRDIETQSPIAEDTVYRIYSSTKIITAVAALICFEENCYQLDDPLDLYLPELSRLVVLNKDASKVSDTEPLIMRPTVRQVLCHNAGFSYGPFQESLVDPLYISAGVLDTKNTLASMITQLAEIPLAYQPGSRFQYSVSSDVAARLVEVWSGLSFQTFLEDRIFKPLGMIDSGFYLKPGQSDRVATNYIPHNPLEPMQGGLTAAPPDTYITPKTFFSGGAGLLSTIPDYTQFIRMLAGNGSLEGIQILSPSSLALMQENQLPEGVRVRLPNWYMPDTLFGIGVALKQAPQQGEPDSAIGEYHWGGVAGTHSFISPQANLAGIIFTQRLPGFWHPFAHDFKRLAYSATES